MNAPVIEQIVRNIKYLLSKNKIKDALDILEQEIAPISDDLERHIIMQKGRFSNLEDDILSGIISDSDYRVELRRIGHTTLLLIDKINDEIKVQQIMGKYTSMYTTSSMDHLQKIQGPENSLVPMNWIYKCMEASKSICQVIRDDGSTGTGWLLEGGWMMTNFHVIPNIDWIKRSEILFNFEENLRGSNKQTSRYQLDPEGAIFSNLFELDYAYIKVKDNGDKALSEWSFLEPDLFSTPQIDQRVSIIQHPKGEKKQIALTDNKILNVDGDKLFYLTDTEKGSSGSPVLNSDWKVVALHHAGKSDDDGGLVINRETGEKRGANEGILIKKIMEDIKEKQSNQ